MTNNSVDGERRWLSVSKYPYGSDPAVERAKEERLIGALRRAAPDADARAIKRAVWDIQAMGHVVKQAPDPVKVRTELAKLSKALATMKAALNSVSAEAYDAIDYETERDLGWVAKCLRRQYRLSKEYGPPKDVEPAVRRRRFSRKRTGRAMTRQTAMTFLALTGRRPTVITPSDGGKAHGPFLDLLAEVFAQVGINASPESQARAFIATMEKNAPESG